MLYYYDFNSGKIFKILNSVQTLLQREFNATFLYNCSLWYFKIVLISNVISLHCTDFYHSKGVELTGAFIAVCCLCDMINTEQEVDVFRVVKHIRQTRPQFIPTLVRKKFPRISYILDFRIYIKFFFLCEHPLSLYLLKYFRCHFGTINVCRVDLGRTFLPLANEVAGR